MQRRVWWFGAVTIVGAALSGCAPTEGVKLARFADPPRVEDTRGAPVVGRYRSEWRAYLTKQRELQVARLRAYAAREQYALNDGDGLRFVWRDAEGRLCAMANLVNESGRADLVEDVAQTQNDLQLASVTDGPLLEWMLTSGLLQEETQLIQGPDFQIRQRSEARSAPKPVAIDPFGDAPRVAWEIRRKHAHLDSAVERLEMDFSESIEAALDRLGARLDEPPA
ncbi:MAG: hypothetical protein U0414_20760 [Polyangiaceae bacterium]